MSGFNDVQGQEWVVVLMMSLESRRDGGMIGMRVVVYYVNQTKPPYLISSKKRNAIKDWEVRCLLRVLAL